MNALLVKRRRSYRSGRMSPRSRRSSSSGSAASEDVTPEEMAKRLYESVARLAQFLIRYAEELLHTKPPKRRTLRRTKDKGGGGRTLSASVLLCLATLGMGGAAWVSKKKKSDVSTDAATPNETLLNTDKKANDANNATDKKANDANNATDKKANDANNATDKKANDANNATDKLHGTTELAVWAPNVVFTSTFDDLHHLIYALSNSVLSAENQILVGQLNRFEHSQVSQQLTLSVANSMQAADMSPSTATKSRRSDVELRLISIAAHAIEIMRMPQSDSHLYWVYINKTHALLCVMISMASSHSTNDLTEGLGALKELLSSQNHFQLSQRSSLVIQNAIHNVTAMTSQQVTTLHPQLRTLWYVQQMLHSKTRMGTIQQDGATQEKKKMITQTEAGVGAGDENARQLAAFTDIVKAKTVNSKSLKQCKDSIEQARKLDKDVKQVVKNIDGDAYKPFLQEYVLQRESLEKKCKPFLTNWRPWN
jgi:hypothetical protein